MAGRNRERRDRGQPHRNGRGNDFDGSAEDEYPDAAIRDKAERRDRARGRDRRTGRADPEPRRQGQRTPPKPAPPPAAREPQRSPVEAAWARLLTPTASAQTCGACRNWLGHDEPGGRGTCDHPGSGFSFPFSDSPACPFFQSRR